MSRSTPRLRLLTSCPHPHAGRSALLSSMAVQSRWASAVPRRAVSASSRALTTAAKTPKPRAKRSAKAAEEPPAPEPAWLDEDVNFWCVRGAGFPLHPDVLAVPSCKPHFVLIAHNTTVPDIYSPPQAGRDRDGPEAERKTGA